MNGEWKLSISVSQPDYSEEEYEGKLLDWKLHIKSKPCEVRPKWEKLPMPPSSYSPRRLHTAIAVDKSIFIAGGFASRRLSDLWRFDYEANTWTELNGAAIRDDWPLNGQNAILTQYGLLAVGGLAPYGPRSQGHDLWLLDLFEEDWISVPIPQSLSVQEDGRFK